MMPDEKTQLLALLEHHGKWCRDAEAHDANGDPVTYDDDAAVAWDITGALCRLFGWQRACVLFGQMERHIVGKRRTVGWPMRDTGIDAMKALQDFTTRPRPRSTCCVSDSRRCQFGTVGTERMGRQWGREMRCRLLATRRSRHQRLGRWLDRDAIPA